MVSFKSKSEILSYISTINPIKYEQTRNSLTGAVTRLSPYITCGLITLNQVKNIILAKNSSKNSYKLIQELAWRDYFQSVYLSKQGEIFEDLKSGQDGVKSLDMPKAILEASTGIEVIDNAIKKLYLTGYIHNHERMWLASIVCSIAGTKWQTGAKWMYHYLKDGDLASNMLSWQWVCGTFSSKKYYANQENLNKYSDIKQFGTFLDKSYDELMVMDTPEILITRQALRLETELIIPDRYIFEKNFSTNLVLIDKNTLNSNHTESDSDVILFIDIEEQTLYPISQIRMDFIISILDMELPNCKILLAGQSKKIQICNLYTKVIIPKQERMFPTLTDYYPSFFKFWDRAGRL